MTTGENNPTIIGPDGQCWHCFCKNNKASKRKSSDRIRKHTSRHHHHRHNNESSIANTEMFPDDLPQVGGFCCGHSYLKLSNADSCSCECPQCIELECGNIVTRTRNHPRVSLKKLSRMRSKSQSTTTATLSTIEDHGPDPIPNGAGDPENKVRCTHLQNNQYIFCFL
jgi:hypothetical protein